jgi:hypothetical protein
LYLVDRAPEVVHFQYRPSAQHVDRISQDLKRVACQSILSNDRLNPWINRFGVHAGLLHAGDFAGHRAEVDLVAALDQLNQQSAQREQMPSAGEP